MRRYAKVSVRPPEVEMFEWMELIFQIRRLILYGVLKRNSGISKNCDTTDEVYNIERSHPVSDLDCRPPIAYTVTETKRHIMVTVAGPPT